MIALRALLLTLTLLAVSAHGSVIIVGTRVIYPGGSRDVSVRLLNRGDRPALVQAWLDKGDSKSTPDSISVPFALNPSLTRIDPERGQVLRLTYTGEPLPQDKESVFWLNVLEVPPKATGEEASHVLQFALRTRIKLFYRPKGLKDKASDAARALQWRLVRSGGTWTAEGRNASPYFVSFAGLSVRPDAKDADALATAPGGMIEPGATQTFELANVKPALAAGGPLLLRYTFIDDYGAFVDNDTPLPESATPAPAAAPPQGK
ncbi:fimbria/pilus periplasmic chaperone [Caenimonas aquaedulcis]|uniref:Fimbria/pilus periplasmic chaperone n=1 Tax=Caenimonas aquaedulcis TaxID=2793270 RepID=A0A931MJ32_9BURK|nr:fimbria/pilus periplasmic chaperone [Caenimonas aquaedulcis]MBG9390662.1 fimbria/pilus periplasmic chaperone [Caenimonas aquaedulcis]